MSTKKNKDALGLLETISGRRLTLGSAIWSIRTNDEFSQVEFAELLGHPVITFVQLAIQDQLNNERLKLKVNLQEVA